MRLTLTNFLFWVPPRSRTVHLWFLSNKPVFHSFSNFAEYDYTTILRVVFTHQWVIIQNMQNLTPGNMYQFFGKLLIIVWIIESIGFCWPVNTHCWILGNFVNFPIDLYGKHRMWKTVQCGLIWLDTYHDILGNCFLVSYKYILGLFIDMLILNFNEERQSLMHGRSSMMRNSKCTIKESPSLKWEQNNSSGIENVQPTVTPSTDRIMAPQLILSMVGFVDSPKIACLSGSLRNAYSGNVLTGMSLTKPV